MKILVMNDSNELSGGAEVIFNIQVNLLRHEGHEVFTFCFGRTFRTDGKNLQLPINSNWFLRKFFKITLHPKVYLDLRSFIVKTNPDLIILHNNALYPISVLLACRGYKVLQIVHDFYLVCPTSWAVFKSTLEVCPGGVGLKCIKKGCVNPLALIFFHWPLFLIRNMVLKKVVHSYIAPSQVLYKSLKEFGFPARLLHNPAPIFDIKSQLSAVGFAETLPSKDSVDLDAPYLLYVGKLSNNKGVDILINAFARIYSSYPWIKLKIVGDGPSKRSFEILASDLGLTEAVQFLGLMPREKLPELYKRAIALVVPSICQENFPTVVTEGMTFGCPVIGSARGGIPEILGDNERGLLFKPGDVNDLVDKLLLLLHHPVLRDRLIKQANLYISNVLDLESYKNKFNKIIYNILNEHSNGVLYA
jgi:glycosyltransferase involved in cell wall biosynthesis